MENVNESIIKISEPFQLSMEKEWFKYAKKDHFWFKWRLRAALNQFEDLKIQFNRPLKVLDVGGGNAEFAFQLESKTDWIIDVTDLDYDALQSGRKIRGRKLLYNISEEDINFLEKYDMIILYDVIEHIKETKKFIFSCLKHLKRNGYLFINVPAFQSLYSAYDEVAGHFRRYNKSIMENELVGSNLLIVDQRYWGLLLIPFLLIRKFFVNIKKDRKGIIKIGFCPPGKMANSLFIFLMYFETIFLKKIHFWGTSLMCACKKV